MKERLKRMVSGIPLGLVNRILILYGKSIVNPEQAGYGNLVLLNISYGFT
jgi:hypothetical protein